MGKSLNSNNSLRYGFGKVTLADHMIVLKIKVIRLHSKSGLQATNLICIN